MPARGQRAAVLRRGGPLLLQRQRREPPPAVRQLVHGQDPRVRQREARVEGPGTDEAARRKGLARNTWPGLLGRDPMDCLT